MYDNRFMNWANKRIDYLSAVDIMYIKWACIAFGIMLVAIFPGLARAIGWLTWLIVTLILLFKPMKSFLFSKTKVDRK